MYFPDYDDAQLTEGEWERFLYDAYAYPPIAYAFEQGFPRRDFLRNPHALPF